MSIIRFALDDLDAITDAMATLTDAGHGWINAVPATAERAHLVATRSVPGLIFGRVGGRGPNIPKITWTAPEARRNRTDPAQIGIEHPFGSRSARHLAEVGQPVPEGWVVLQDHAIRGLVVALGRVARDAGDRAEPLTANNGDEEADGANGNREAIAWAIGAAVVLAGDHGPTWQAQVFDPR